MARIIGVQLQDDWKLDYALTHIKGIGWSSSERILKDLKINSSKRVKDLSPKEVAQIVSKMDEYETEGDLIRNIRNNIQRLRVIKSYKGLRHAQGLPVRGQRTKSNARTKRGKRKTVGSFKKEALSKMQQH